MRLFMLEKEDSVKAGGIDLCRITAWMARFTKANQMECYTNAGKYLSYLEYGIDYPGWVKMQFELAQKPMEWIVTLLDNESLLYTLEAVRLTSLAWVLNSFYTLLYKIVSCRNHEQNVVQENLRTCKIATLLLLSWQMKVPRLLFLKMRAGSLGSLYKKFLRRTSMRFMHG